MPLILGTNSIKDTGYNVANSLRFNNNSSDSLSLSTSGADETSWTYSVWVKRSEITYASLFSAISGSNFVDVYFYGTSTADGYLEFYSFNGSFVGRLVTNAFFRDPSAWYNIVIVWDSDNSTSGDRMRIYVNGVRVTSFSTESQPSSGASGYVNGTFKIGAMRDNNSSYFFDGYMAEACFIDGQSLDATSFGEFDSDSPNIWRPIDVSGLTFGTNGFHLDFENASSLGADVSGNSNNFTVNNLTSIDQSTDTCTNNFCTMNPLDNQIQSSTFSDGNLSLTSGGSGIETYNTSTFGLSSGKWYMELKHTGGNNVLRQLIGITQNPTDDDGQYLGGDNNDSWGYYDNNGNIAHNASTVITYDSWTTNDIIGLALDLDNSRLYFSKNGTFQNSSNPADGTNPITIDSGYTYFIAWGDLSAGNMNASFNFGSPAYSISSGNSDANGHGNFEYSVPSGYFAICSKNLAEFG